MHQLHASIVLLSPHKHRAAGMGLDRQAQHGARCLSINDAMLRLVSQPAKLHNST